MKEGQNYKVSVEVKADSEKEVLFRFKDILHSESHAQKKVTVNTEWQTVVFETGSWQADWESIFQVFMGMVDKIYLRNLKIETLDTKVLPVAASEKSILSNITEDGFTVQIDDTSEWISIEGQKVEFGNLYLVSFDVVAEEETNIEFVAKASTKKYADAWYKTTIGTASTKVELYVPHVGSESDFDFIDMGFNSSVATTLTVSNFEVATVPMDEKPAVVIAISGENDDRWDQFMGHFGSGTFFTLAAGESVEIFAHIGAENFNNWDVVSELRTLTPSDFCSVSVNSDGRPVITNNTNVNRKYILCVNSDYLLVVTDESLYQVTFDPNGGTIDGSSSTVTKEVCELLDVTPVKDGCSFLGWVDVDGNIVSEIQPGITVYAKWSNNLELFAKGDIVGDFAAAGISFTSEGDGVYSATFIYDSSYMNSWGSPSGTCAFKARTVANSWGGTSYGIADSANQPKIGGDAVLIDSVQGNNIVVSGFLDGTAYKITFICAQDGTVTVKVEETETYTMTISARPITQGYTDVPKGYIVDLSSIGEGTDYVVLGWFTDENFTEPVEFPYTINSDVTFYAKIDSNQVCKVIFYGVDTPDLTFNYGDIINEGDLPVVSLPEGYTFDGWYLDSGKTEKLTYPYTITHDIGLHLGYKQN